MSRVRDERGQTTMLVIAFASLIAVAIALVVDASAAFMQRQGLNSLADGAALYGADQGAVGVYTGGLPETNLDQRRAQASAAVGEYLARTGAHATYPGIGYTVALDPARDTITVRLHAPLDLPLTVPGAPASTVVGAEGTAAVTIAR
ncbi:MAG TPA: pilus assembly protein TadG-related protein [Nocardioides sp.]